MKNSQPIVWWDRARARWTAPPHRKERSYNEHVGGNPGRSGEGLRRERHDARSVLARYAAGSEAVREGLEDLVGTPRPSTMRWATGSPRREALASGQLRRLRDTGRKLLAVRPFYLRYPLRALLHTLLGAACTEALLDTLAATTRALWSWRRYPFRANVRAVRVMATGPLLRGLFPMAPALRWRVARALLLALEHYSLHGGARDAHDMLASLTSDDGRLAPARAQRWAALLGYTDDLLSHGHLRTQHDAALAALAWRALDASPSLRAQLEGWLARNLERAV